MATMAIDRSGRAQRRWQRRATGRTSEVVHERRPAREHRPSADAALGLDGLFNPGARHQQEHLRRVELVTEDDRSASNGGGPLDLDSGVVRLNRSDSREPGAPAQRPER